MATRQKSKAQKFRRKAEAHGTAVFRCIDGTQSAKSNADGQYIESLLDLTGFFFFFFNIMYSLENVKTETKYQVDISRQNSSF